MRIDYESYDVDDDEDDDDDDDDDESYEDDDDDIMERVSINTTFLIYIIG